MVRAIRAPTMAVLAALTGLAVTACGENEDATDHIRSVLVGEVVSPDTAAPADTAELAAVADSAAPSRLTLPNGDTLTVRPAVMAFYRDRGYQPAWTDDDEILDRGKSLLEAIGLANTEGLDRERYHYSTAREMARLLGEDAVEDQELEYLGNLDILLTESFVRLSNDLARGTIDPEQGDVEWRIERGTVDDRALIARVVEGEDPKRVLGTVRPNVPYYDRMIRALRQLRDIEEQGGWATVPEGETLKPGDRDGRVAALRARLSAGDDEDEVRLAAHGAAEPQLFDDSLAAALEHFQTRHNLFEDGALGPNTLEALNVPVSARIENLRLNLDRWRWLPTELGEKFLMVNIAGFELEVVEGDSAIESMNVVVGKTANRTPIFQDTLEHMVVNPYWNVPASIAREEIIPAASRDPGYLARNNYEVVYDGNPVSTARISTAALESGQYRIRQRPGPGNALGEVKFLFPNEHNIYLHDTPAAHLFSQKMRAFSHGCIRVERPRDLARTLLGWLTDRDPGDYDALRQRSGEQWIPLDEKVPVYILYFTAWVDTDGTIRFHDDIYDRDRSIEEEARERLAPVQPDPIPVGTG